MSTQASQPAQGNDKARTLLVRTPRLELGPLLESDAEDLFRYRSAPEVARWQGWVPESVDAARSFAAAQGRTARLGGVSWSQFAMRLREGGRLIGDLGVRGLDPEGAQFEIGVTVDPQHQRRGLAAEALRALVDALCAHPELHRVTASVDPRNVPSMELFAKLGFRQEAHHRRSLWFKGEWVDDVIFAVLAQEWRARAEPTSGSTD